MKTITGGVLVKMTRDEFSELLAEGFHTAFRKASDHPISDEIWRSIRKLPPCEWGKVIDFVVFGLEGQVEFAPKKRRNVAKGGPIAVATTDERG